MSYAIGAAVGLVWGLLAALVNNGINRRAMKKNSSRAVMTASAARLVVDLVTLGTVFLLRKRLPFSFEATMIAAAISLSTLNVVFSYLSIRSKP